MDKDISKPSQVEEIAKLAKDAQGFTVGSITFNGEGLPPTVPFGFDHRSNGSGAGFRSLHDEIEKYRLYPARRGGTATVQTLGSFVDLVRRHMTDHSVLFYDTVWPNPSITAIINYHELDPHGKAQFGDHRIHYPFPLTDEFKAWAGMDGKPMDQGKFAVFIEERIAELALADPEEDTEYGQLFQTKMATPAEMIALSRGLEVNVAGRVKQAVKLSSGEADMVFTEQHQDGNGNKITVPGLFMVSVPAFLGGEAVRLPARLRYRVSEGSVTWFYQLYRWKELLRLRVLDDVTSARDGTDLPVYEGSPES